MHLCSCLLSVCLVGQVGRIPDPPVSPPAIIPAAPMTANGAAAGGATPASISAHAIATPDQLVADAIALPTDGSITGRPISLLSALSAMPDRAKQLDAVHAYWRLVQAIGDYRYCHERQRRLVRLKASTEEAAD